jgi:hypothetical protein
VDLHNPTPEKAKKPRRRPWQAAFLTTLADTGNVRASCEAAKICRPTAYDCRHADPAFAAAWDSALDEAMDLLEREGWRRARTGIDEPVIYQGELCGAWVDAKGKEVAKDSKGAKLIPLVVKRYSDTLLIFLLKGGRPNKYRETYKHEHTGPEGKPILFIEVPRAAASVESSDVLPEVRLDGAD